MSGYKNRTITLCFDGTSELDDMGEGVFVTMRNPKLMSAADLTPREVPLDEHGNPKDREEAMKASYELIATMITSWNVYDAADPSDDPEPLAHPATPELVAKLPMAILQAVSHQMDAINPKG